MVYVGDNFNLDLLSDDYWKATISVEHVKEEELYNYLKQHSEHTFCFTGRAMYHIVKNAIGICEGETWKPFTLAPGDRYIHCDYDRNGALRYRSIGYTYV